MNIYVIVFWGLQIETFMSTWTNILGLSNDI